MVSTRQMSITTTVLTNTAEDAITASTTTTATSTATISNSTASILPTFGTSSTTISKTNYGNTILGTSIATQIGITPVVTATSISLTSNALTDSNSSTIINKPKNLINLLELPVEILDIIFSHVGFKKTAQLRSVSRQMNTVCSSILNSTFQRLQTQLLNRIQTVKAKMPRRESARRNHPLTCEYDIIETCYMRLSLLQMTFGKHIERKHCCFFPGGILDEVFNVLTYIRITAKIARPFRVTDELFDLSTMAMEYFKEYIEPDLPEIGYFVRKDFIDFATNTKPNFLLDTKSSSSLSSSTSRESNSSTVPSPPQSNMVLRKGIRKIKQGMKRYNNQLSVLRSELRTCKRKATEQAKQISDQQKLLAEQQKQTLEYANRLDENDKKNEEMSRKFSTMLQELNKCKTELQYWRSKSPATPMCVSCGQVIALPLEDIEALVNQGVKPEDMGLNYVEDDFDDDVHKDDDIENNIDIIEKLAGPKLSIINNELTKNVIVTTAKISSKRKLIDDYIDSSSLTVVTLSDSLATGTAISAPVVTTATTTNVQTKPVIETTPTSTIISECNTNENLSKKIRRVQNKNRCQNYSNIVHNNKTRSK